MGTKKSKTKNKNINRNKKVCSIDKTESTKDYEARGEG